MNDFENTLKRLHNENVDAALGQGRTAPPFEPPAIAAGRREVRPWLLPLVAAACIAAATVATVGTTQVLTQHRTVPPASPTPSLSQPVTGSPTGSSPPPSTSPSATPSGSDTGRKSATPSPSKDPAPTVTWFGMGTAMIALPSDWTFRLASTGANDQFTSCMRPATASADACVIQLRTIPLASRPLLVDSDAIGGIVRNESKYCDGQLDQARVVGNSADRILGGRSADYRHFAVSCPNGQDWQIEQYVVPTAPGYILFSDQADSEVDAVMSQLAQRSILPPSRGGERYYDHGYLRATRSYPNQERITLYIDRVVPGPQGGVNVNPQTYQYDVRRSQLEQSHLKVGDLMTIFTDSVITLQVRAG